MPERCSVVKASVKRAEEGLMEKTGKASRKGAQEVFTGWVPKIIAGTSGVMVPRPSVL